MSLTYRKFTVARLILLFLALGCLWSPLTRANVVGVDTQNFNPITSGIDFVTVQSSETLDPGILNFGMFLNYAINSLPNYLDSTTQSRSKARDRLLSSDLNFGLGLRRGWDIGFSFPAVLSQQVDSDVFKGVFDKTGMTDIRFNTKVRFTGDKDGGFAMIGTVELPQVQNNPFYGASNAPTYNIELAADTTVRRVAMGLNLGYRIRNTGGSIAGVPISPIGNMYIASIAASYLFSKIDSKLITEIFASQPAQNTSATQTDRELSSAEWLVGLKTDASTQLALHYGISTGINHGTFSPDWRIYLGMNWAMGPLWGTKAPVVVKAMQVVPVQTVQPTVVAPIVAPTQPKQVAKVTAEVVDEGTDDAEPEEPAWVAQTPAPEPTGSVAEVTTLNTTPEQADYFKSRTPEKRELFVVRNLNFKSGSAKIPIDFKNYIEKLAVYLNRKPVFKRLVITGHTDSVGEASSNLRLSRARAYTLKRALSELFGLPADKIEVQGYGQERPIADNGNYQGRARNRRVELYIER